MSLAIVSNDIGCAEHIGKKILEYGMKNGYYTDVLHFSSVDDFLNESQNRVFSTILCAVDEIKALNVVDEVKERLPHLKLAVIASSCDVAAHCFKKGVDFCAEKKLDEASMKRIVELCFSM